MKTGMKNSKAIIVAMMTAFTTMSAGPVLAMEKSYDPPTVAVKYVGNLQADPVFQLNLSNSNADQFLVTIRNSAGITLHAEKLSGENITRRYRIDMSDSAPDDVNLRFEVKSLTTKKTDVYDVSTNVNVVRDVVVSKVSL